MYNLCDSSDDDDIPRNSSVTTSRTSNHVKKKQKTGPTTTLYSSTNVATGTNPVLKQQEKVKGEDDNDRKKDPDPLDLEAHRYLERLELLQARQDLAKRAARSQSAGSAVMRRRKAKRRKYTKECFYRCEYNPCCIQKSITLKFQ